MPGRPSRLLVSSNDSRIRLYEGLQQRAKYKGHKNNNSKIRATTSPGEMQALLSPLSLVSRPPTLLSLTPFRCSTSDVRCPAIDAPSQMGSTCCRGQTTAASTSGTPSAQAQRPLWRRSSSATSSTPTRASSKCLCLSNPPMMGHPRLDPSPRHSSPPTQPVISNAPGFPHLFLWRSRRPVPAPTASASTAAPVATAGPWMSRP